MNCGYCTEKILPGEEDPWNADRHLECGLRSAVGSAAHQLKECSCFGGTREDPPGMSRRDAAKLAAITFGYLNPQVWTW
jgi:hypothetical protein